MKMKLNLIPMMALTLASSAAFASDDNAFHCSGVAKVGIKNSERPGASRMFVKLYLDPSLTGGKISISETRKGTRKEGVPYETYDAIISGGSFTIESGGRVFMYHAGNHVGSMTELKDLNGKVEDLGTFYALDGLLASDDGKSAVPVTAVLECRLTDH